MNAENAPDRSLNEEYKLAQQLIELLKQEQAHLVKADVKGLTAVTEEKARAVSDLAKFTNLRYVALSKAGFIASESGMRTWLNASPAPDAEKCWKDLVQLAQSAKSLNKTNGLLISKLMTHNQNALNVLQGSRATNFYGPNGQSTTKIRPRGLVLG
jgi:flagella synthesis protein FlgN